jgi:hypothetical protein
MAARAASKSSKWFSDTATYPLLFCISAGAVMCMGSSVRFLTKSPDVKWNREVRKDPKLALRDRSDWTSHRRGIKNMSENRVNALHEDK